MWAPQRVRAEPSRQKFYGALQFKLKIMPLSWHNINSQPLYYLTLFVSQVEFWIMTSKSSMNYWKFGEILDVLPLQDLRLW